MFLVCNLDRQLSEIPYGHSLLRCVLHILTGHCRAGATEFSLDYGGHVFATHQDFFSLWVELGSPHTTLSPIFWIFGYMRTLRILLPPSYSNLSLAGVFLLWFPSFFRRPSYCGPAYSFNPTSPRIRVNFNTNGYAFGRTKMWTKLGVCSLGRLMRSNMKIKVRVTNFEPGLHLTFSNLFLEGTHSFAPYSADWPFPSGSVVLPCWHF